MAELYYIQVIRKCNQNCRFCSNPSNEKAITAAAARKLIDKYARLNAAGIIFTGGEPTLYQGLAGLIKYTAGKNIEPRITTNCQKISDMSYLQSLRDAGLSHIHCSLYSHEARTHEYLTRTPGSYGKLTRALYNAWKLGIRTDINTVINRFNSRKLHLLAEFIIDNFPFVRHFVFNNMDPGMDRAVEDTSTVPVMSEFEASLAKAMRLITESGRTFRVERVPLCFMRKTCGAFFLKYLRYLFRRRIHSPESGQPVTFAAEHASVAADVRYVEFKPGYIRHTR